MLLILIGAIAGWKIADLRVLSFTVLALAALVPTWVSVALQNFPYEPDWWVSVWMACFAQLAVPYASVAWLKRMRDRNRADEA